MNNLFKNLDLEKIEPCLIRTGSRNDALAALLFLSEILGAAVDKESLNCVLKHGDKNRFIGRGFDSNNIIYTYEFQHGRKIYESIDELLDDCKKPRIYKDKITNLSGTASYVLTFNADEQSFQIGTIKYPVTLLGKLNELVAKDKN